MKESAQAPDIQVLSQEIEVGMDGGNFESSDRVGRYRLRIGEHVRYLTIATDVFDEETMSIPRLLLPRLPTLPGGPWTIMNISKGKDGFPRSSLSYEPLKAVTSIWHPQRIDILSLPEVRHLKSEVYETIYQGRRVIAKMASFNWHIGPIENETFLYSLMTQDSMAYKYIPGFIGHLTENGRVMGMLLEFLEGRAAGIEDLERCASVLSWLHRLGIVHGDVNRHNFVVNNMGHVYVIDFANAEPWTAEGARKEMEGLREQLEETHLRGAPSHDC
ncbi:hypothetical protein NHJ13734_002670 [Beauveria thailandica]